MQDSITLIHNMLGLDPGNIVLTNYQVEAWGSVLKVDGIYRYPPEEKPFTIIFRDIRSIDVYVQKPFDTVSEIKEAQLMTHDLGEINYGRTARLASVAVELVISYKTLDVQKRW